MVLCIIEGKHRKAEAMKKKKREIFLAGLLVALLAGCGADKGAESVSEEPEADSKEEIWLPDEEGEKGKYTDVSGLTAEPGTHIALVLKNLESSYWKAVREGAEQAVERINGELGYSGEDQVYLTVDGTKGEEEEAVDTQINTLDALLAENPGALCLAAVDMQSCQAQMEAARESEIPVVILDSGIDSELVAAVCMTDNRTAAKEAARQLCGRLGQEGQVAVISYSRRTETSEQRVQGFLQEVQENHPEVQVMEILYEEEDQTAGELWLQLREAYPDLDGLFCTSSTVTLQVLDELEDEEQLEIVSFDADQRQLEAIEEGKLSGTICQNPRGMGYAAVAAALRAMAGETLDRHIDTGYQWVDRQLLQQQTGENYLYDE